MQAKTNNTDASESSSVKGEILRTAMVLVKSKGSKALDYAKRKAEVMKDGDDEEDIVYWQRISKQVEILLYSNE